MVRFALKTTLAKKRRLISTALSVLLGIAFLSGTFVFTDTIQRTFDDLFAGVFENTDSYVRSTNEIDLQFGDSERGRIPQSIVETVRSVDGVADAQGVLQGYAQLIDANGDVIGDPGQGAPTFGMSYVSGELSPWRLTEGSRAPGAGEIAIDKGSADKGDFAIGDTVQVLTQTGVHEFTLVGTVRFGSVDSPGGASVSLLDLATAQEVLLGRAGELDSIMVDAEPGVTQEEVTSRINAVLPDDTEAITGEQIIDETQDQMREGLSFFNTFLLVFAGIGLVVAAFTIYNTFQIVVTQRLREMALLRAIGASRRQVMSSQLLEAVIIGSLASLFGIGAGVVVAGGLKGMLTAFGIDIPAGGTVLLARTVIVSLVVGITVTIVSAIMPARRASRIPPLAAIREITFDGGHQFGRRLGEGLAVFGLGILAFVLGLGPMSSIQLVGLGALFVLVGVFILGPLIARPVARVLGGPLPAMAGITGSIARENAMRNPKRTARTGGALMVGVALVAGITVIAASARDWIRDVYAEQFTGDFVVGTNMYNYGGLSPTLAEELNQLPEVAAATGVRAGAASELGPNGGDTAYVAVDPATAGKLFDIGMVQGSVEDLTADGILVHDDTAKDRGVTVGDTLDFRFLNGMTRTLTVQGIYTEDAFAGAFVVSHALHEQTGADQFDFSVYVLKADGVSNAAAKAAIEQVAAPFASAEVQSRDEAIDEQAAQVNQLLNLIYGLLALAVIIALFSIANSMSLSIYERTHELGLLRAVGMTRRQTRSSVRWESIVIALLGTLLGIVIGVFFGWSVSVALRDEGLMKASLPVVSLVVIVLLAVIGGIIATIRPARRAAKVDVLRAITTE